MKNKKGVYVVAIVLLLAMLLVACKGGGAQIKQTGQKFYVENIVHGVTCEWVEYIFEFKLPNNAESFSETVYYWDVEEGQYRPIPGQGSRYLWHEPMYAGKYYRLFKNDIIRVVYNWVVSREGSPHKELPKIKICFNVVYYGETEPTTYEKILKVKR